MTTRGARLILFLLVAALPIAAILVPLASFVLLSLHPLVDGAIATGWTLGNYGAFLSSPTYYGVFLDSLVLCVKVAVIGLLLGYPMAWFVWRRHGRSRFILLFATVLPLFMSYIVKIYTMRAILGWNGFLNSFLVWSGLLAHPSMVFLYNQMSVLLTMAVIYLPFAALPIFASLERIPAGLLQASADLGAAPGATFRHIVLPLSAPGTTIGVLFVFILAMGDFVTPQMVGGPSGFTFGRVIWSQFGLAYNWPFGAALGMVLLTVALAIVALAGRLGGLAKA
jgi:spermidine/putrescine transport system permease protein